MSLTLRPHASLIRSLGLTDRGIKRARFVVIKNIKVPGILVEGGFMSGAPDYQMINTPAYRQKMAQCIADGINRYKQAITGQVQYQEPSAVVSGTDPTSAPLLDKPKPTPTPAPVGEATKIDSSVNKAKDAIQSGTMGD